jgi:predicted Zn-dependent protease
VLGHEIGHVTGRHSAEQMSSAQLANVGFGLGRIFVPEVRPYGDVLQTGLGLLFLKFGRDDELQADRLGVRYSLAAGYDARRMGSFFDVLDRLNDKSGSALPTWLSTHPNPRDRKEKIFELVDQAAVGGTRLTIGDDEFKRKLEGLVYGDNPREGFMDGDTFKHPVLRFQIVFPEGWQVQNTRQAVFAGSRDAGFQLTLARATGGGPDAHAAQVFRSYSLEAGRGTSTRIGGFPAFVAPFRARTQRGVLDGEAAFIVDGNNVFELFLYTSSDRFRRLQPTFQAVVESFARLRDREALNRQPDRIRIHRVASRTTLRAALSAAGISEQRWDEFALLNQTSLDRTVSAGTLLKLVKPGRGASN